MSKVEQNGCYTRNAVEDVWEESGISVVRCDRTLQQVALMYYGHLHVLGFCFLEGRSPTGGSLTTPCLGEENAT